MRHFVAPCLSGFAKLCLSLALMATGFSFALGMMPAALAHAAEAEARAANEWYGLMLNPSAATMEDILASYADYQGAGVVASVAKQVANCEALEGTVVLVNPFELNPYQGGSHSYTFNVTTLSNKVVKPNAQVVLKYLCAGEGSSAGAGAAAVAGTREELTVTAEGDVTFSLQGGGVYALGPAAVVDAIAIDPSVPAQDVPTVTEPSNVPNDVTVGAGGGSASAGSSGLSGGSISTPGTLPPIGGRGMGAGAGAAGALGADGAAGAVAGAPMEGALIGDTPVGDADAPLGEPGEEAGDAVPSLFERLFLQGGGLNKEFVTFLILVVLLLCSLLGLFAYYFIKRRAYDKAVRAAQRAEALAASGSDEGSEASGQTKEATA